MTSFVIKKANQSVAVLAATSLLALTACDEAIVVTPGAIDASDTCSRYQQGIVDARKKSNELRVQNAAAGALAGALVGAAVSDSTEGALIGALLGAALAGAATAENQKQKASSDAELLRDVNTKAGQVRGLLTEAGRNANALRSCRLQQVGALERSVRSGKVSGKDAGAELTVLKRRANADNQIISASFNGIGEKVDSFVNTTAKSSGVESAIITRQKAANSASARKVQAATGNVPAAISAKNQLIEADQRKRQQTENAIEAIEVLLS